jgi:hypothetical protein
MVIHNARFRELWEVAFKKKNEADEARSRCQREKGAAKEEAKRLEEEKLDRNRQKEAAKDALLAQVELGLFGKLSIEV